MGIEEEPVGTEPNPVDLEFENDQRFEDNVIEAPRKYTKSFEKIVAEPGQRKSIDMPGNTIWFVGELFGIDIEVPWNSTLRVELARDCRIIAKPESKVGVLEADSTYELIQDGVTTVFGKSARIVEDSKATSEERSDEIPRQAA